MSGWVVFGTWGSGCGNQGEGSSFRMQGFKVFDSGLGWVVPRFMDQGFGFRAQMEVRDLARLEACFW